MQVTYSLNDENELRIQYWARSDSETVLNLTNHSYFNLTGYPVNDILDHELFLNAEHYLPVDDELIPTGEIAAVANTPFDFRQLKRIGQDLALPNQQLQYAQGYDFNWIVSRQNNNGLEVAAKLAEKNTGRTLEIFMTQPGIQFYSGNRLATASETPSPLFRAHSGLTVETQHFPDSVNKPQFPSTVLAAGSIFRSTTILRFSWLRISENQAQP